MIAANRHLCPAIIALQNMKPELKQLILNCSNASDLSVVETVQSLWSGYGEINRVALKGATMKTLIVKHIVLPAQVNHPRGWNSDISHQRKLQSYDVEMHWYRQWNSLCDNNYRTAHCLSTESAGDDRIIVLEDLDNSGFPLRMEKLEPEQTLPCLRWLANFHARFIKHPCQQLWARGSYWHLATRPEELAAMAASRLKEAAAAIDARLNHCQFQTIIHGDAKLANFCFSNDMQSVAAVDFQYVGAGCGIKDVMYFFSSCLTGEQCEQWQEQLLDYYFDELKIALEAQKIQIDCPALEAEWRELYPLAWADFCRFLAGWSPGHHKLNGYSQRLTNKVVNTIL